MVAHADGVTLSQSLGETNVLVKAPGAKGVSIQNQSGAKTDFRGYTTVNNVSPYRKNDVALNTETLADDVELELTTKTVVPTRGAVVRASFTANVGLRVLMTLNQSGGQPVPFGAMVSTTNDEKSGFIVGDAGQVYLSGIAEQGELLVKWGNQSNQQCKVKYNMQARAASKVNLLTTQEKCL